jgi:hypothetical protein
MKTPIDETRPYPPSLLDRFMNFVSRLPISYWLTYLVLFLLENLLVHAVAWIVGWLPAFHFIPILFSFPLWLWGPLALITHLNRVALEALVDFSPLLELDGQQLERLKVEITTMPTRNVIISGLVWSIIYFVMISQGLEIAFTALGLSISFTWFIVVEGLFSFAIGSAIYYHSFRQLRLVNRTVKMIRQFNLFELGPIYSFARVTAQIGMAWIILLSLTLLLFPIKLASLPLLAVLASQVVLAMAAFVLPLLFVNRRLVAEKRRLLVEHNRRLESTLKHLHRCLDEKKMEEASQLNGVVNALNLERNILTGIPTWPWRANTLTSFLSALGLPLVIFFIQLLIKKLLGV